MDGIPVLGNAVLGPGIQRRTPVDLVRQLRLSQRELLPEQQRDLLPSLPSQLAETAQSGKLAHSARFHSKSRSLSPSRRLPAPGEVPWQKFWNGPRERSASRTPSFQRGAIGARASRTASRKASRSRGRGSQSPRSPSRPSSPLLVDSRSAALNERNETRRDRNDRNDRKFELHTLDKSPQGECRDLSDSPLFTVSWDPYTGRRQFEPSERLRHDAASVLGQALLAAAARGDAVQVQGVLEHATQLEYEGDQGLVVADLLETREQKGFTPLHCAAKHGHAEVCAILLKRRADVHAVEGNGATALAMASLHGHRAVVRSLLQQRARPQQSDQKGRNAFHLACCNDPETVRILLQSSLDITLLKDAQDRNALYYAMGNPGEKSRSEILQLLLDRRCSASQVDCFGRPALYYAVQAGALDVVAMLLRAVDLEQLRSSWPDAERDVGRPNDSKTGAERTAAEADATAKPSSAGAGAVGAAAAAAAAKPAPAPDEGKAGAAKTAAEEKKPEAVAEADAKAKPSSASPESKPAPALVDPSKTEAAKSAAKSAAEEKKPEAVAETDAKAKPSSASADSKPAPAPVDPSKAGAVKSAAEEKKPEAVAEADAKAKPSSASPESKPAPALVDPSKAEAAKSATEDKKPEAVVEADTKAKPSSASAVSKPAPSPVDPSHTQAAKSAAEDKKPEAVAEADAKAKPSSASAESKPSPATTDESKAGAAKTAAEDKKPEAGAEGSSVVPVALPGPPLPGASTNETPRSYVDPLPAADAALRLGEGPASGVASELQALVQKHTFLNPATAHCRHPLHCWVSRCAQVLVSDPAEAKACMERIKRGLDLDRQRIDTAFHRFDVDRSDHLDDRELARLAAYLGFDVDPKDLDHDADGSISLNEFQDFVGRMGGVQRLFEQRRQQVASTRRDAASLAGVAVGARVRSHYYAGTKPDRKKSEQAEEAIVIGVHFKGEEDIAAPSQLEVQLEFLRGGRKTCVPAHWIVSTEEDAEVAAALREVGIHEEDQPFWDSIFPASEMREVCRLTSCQRRALAQIRAHAAASHEEAEPRVLERFQKMGFSDKELQAVLSWIQDLAPVIIHVNIDTVGRFLESDEYYRSQFETKTSYGAIDEGNQTRVTWERDLFGDAYDDAKPFERCKYGALNVTNDFEGCKPALQYGDSYLVLKDVRLRCTFAPEDSGGISGSRLAVLDKYAHVLEEYEDEEIRKLVDVATAPPARPSSEAPRLLRGSTEDPTQQWVSFGFPQLKRKAGCFFFEVELIEECSLPQVGLASDLFQCLPGVQSTSGIGDDEYSCGVDGMHGACLKGGPLCAWDVSWKKKDSDVYYEDGHQSVLAERVVVGVVVDFDFRAICFASNGAWSEPWRPQVLEEDMPTFNEGLYPAISLRGRASFQFGPDFKHPPPKSYKWALWPGAGQGRIRIDCPAVGDSRVLNIYKEAQIHGEVSLKRHVLRLVAAQKYKQKARCWTVQVSNAGRCSGTYKWSGRHNRRSLYRSPAGAIIYYCTEDASWHMNDKDDMSGFVFRAPVTSVHLSSASNTPCMEPQRGGWKAALELKGCVRRKAFKPAMLALGVPEDEVETLMDVLSGQAGVKDLIFRKHGVSSFKLEWAKLALQTALREPSCRVPKASEAWTQVVRSAQGQWLEGVGLPRATSAVVLHLNQQCQEIEQLLSLGPMADKEDSCGIAVHVLSLQSPQGTGTNYLALTEPRLTWRAAGLGARAVALLSTSSFLSCLPDVPGTVVERGPGMLRRLLLDDAEVARNDMFWPLQEASADEVAEPQNLLGRWCSRCLGSRCLLEIHSSDGVVLADIWLSRSGTQSLRKHFKGSYDAVSRTLTGTADAEDSTGTFTGDLEEMTLTLSEDGLTLSGAGGGEEVVFHRRTNSKSYVWCSAEAESPEAKEETSGPRQVVVTYGKKEKAGDELLLGISKSSPLAPMFLKAFQAPGPAQEHGIQPGWYLDLDATLFGPSSESEAMQAIKNGPDFPENLEDAYRQIHTLYARICGWLARPGLSLVFCSAVRAELLPEALVRFTGSPRQQLGKMAEDGTLTGHGLPRSSPAHVAGVRAGWQLDLEKSAQLLPASLKPPGKASEVSGELLLNGDSERMLAFTLTSKDEEWEQKEGHEWTEPYWLPGADAVAIRFDSSAGNSDDQRLLVVAVPTGAEGASPATPAQLQKLAEGWEGACDGFYGLKGEEVSVERDSWDEVRLRALCAHHGWDFSWMTEDDERRRRIVEGFAGT